MNYLDPELGDAVPLIPLSKSSPLANFASVSHSNCLLEAVRSNHPELESLLSSLTIDEFLKIPHAKEEYRNILTIACGDSQVNPTTFRTLFKYVVARFDLDKFSEPEWYYFEPIHFAAYFVNVDKLRVILETLREQRQSKRLNSQSVFCENALHVLLAYGKKLESFNIQLSNGWESRVCQVIAKEKSEVVNCTKLLLEAGIDVNHNNIWNETPLLIAIRYRLLGVIQLLLRKPDIDLDTCKDPFKGKSARDLLKENEIHLNLFNPTTTFTTSEVKTLFTYLKSGDEEMFLRFNNENIRQYVDETDDGQITMLQLCLLKGFIDYKRKLPSIGPNSYEQGEIFDPMVTFFCSNGFGRSVEYLLNNGADVMKKARVLGGLNALEMAVKFSYYPFLALILEHKHSKVKKTDLILILKGIDAECFSADNHNARQVLQLVISKLEDIYRVEKYVTFDSFKERVRIKKYLTKIMDLYLEHNGNNDMYKENICQLLRMGATLTGNLRNNEIRLKHVSYETLKMHLDECVDSNNICYDSMIKDDGVEYSETEALHDLCHDPKKNELLNHPALIYLVHSMWLKCNKFFYLNLSLYAGFLLTLYFYIISLQMSVPNAMFKWTFCIFLLIQTAKELIQLVLYWKRYFYDLFNYLEVCAIVSCYVNMFTKKEYFMVIAILLSSCIFLLMLGQLPKFTKYMIVLSSTKYFLEYAAFYFIQFVSFAICFFILLPPERKNITDEGVVHTIGLIGLRLFETLIFFIGQYDGDISEVPKFPIFGRFIVAVFIFCMTIILNNLLVGLIVTDMDVIQKNGKLQRQIKMIRFINRVESFSKQSFYLIKCEWLKKYSITTVFKPGSNKNINDIFGIFEMFEEDDRMWLKHIFENQTPQKSVLHNLYEYLLEEIKSDHGSLKNRDILFKLRKLDEQIRKNYKHRY
ncbi:transient receptor potential cation channel protein painless-like [Euwallacea similis]|uniref:transient receptor potential cation channel protein painless-like n=1 Tax=Euwallacea similis TaxID=1736056 RepID=UPI00344F44D6